MDLTNTRFPRKAAQSRGISASLRRLAARRAAPVLAVGALFAAGLHPAAAISYIYGNTTGNFSTGFSPLFPGGPAGGTTYADSLTFGGTSAYTATDDITTQLQINSMTFNGTGAITVARGTGTNANNSISLGGTNPYVSFAVPASGSVGAVTINTDLSFDSSGFLVKTAPGAAATNPVINGGISLATGTNLTVALNDTPGDAAAELSLNGTISGAGSLTFANNAVVPTTGAALGAGQGQDYGTLLVSGNNTYTGGTNINFGRVVINSATALGTGAINIGQASVANPIGNETVSGGTLAIGGNNGGGAAAYGGLPTGVTSITLANAINLGGAINGDYGNGLSNNGGNNTLSGVVTLTTAQANIAVNNGTTLTVSNGIGQAAGVTGALVKNGNGTLLLANNNTYTGTTTISNGYIQAGTGGTLAGGIVTASSLFGSTSSIINNGGPNGGLTLDFSNAALSLDVSTLGGTTGRITQAGPGTLTLTGTGTQGGFFTSTGTLLVDTGANLTGSNYSSIGVNSGDNGTLTLQGTGSLTQNGDFNIADNVGATGTLNISGSATATGVNVYIAKNATTTGTANISGSGALTATGTGGALQVGTGGGTAVVNQTGGSVATTQGELWIGNGTGSNGTYNISAGTLATGSWLAVGRQAGSTGVLNISGTASITKGGTNTSNLTVAGDGGIESGTINQTGGTLTNTVSQTWIGESGNGTYNLSGGSANLGVLNIDEAGSAAASSGVVNLSGTGLLSTTQVIKGATVGTATLNFNGGTLQANTGAVATGSGTFLGGLDAANVQTGGATFDTNGNSVTVTQNLLHGTTTATDGGLTKIGAGMLTLSGADTYNGATKISAGQLSVTTIASLGAGSLLLPDSTTDWVNLMFTGTETINSLSFNSGSSFAPAGTYGAANSGATFTSTAFTGTGILNVAAAPEPSQFVAFGLGLLGLGGLVLRARRRTAAPTV